jgi:hypothetical protein
LTSSWATTSPRVRFRGVDALVTVTRAVLRAHAHNVEGKRDWVNGLRNIPMRTENSRLERFRRIQFSMSKRGICGATMRNLADQTGPERSDSKSDSFPQKNRGMEVRKPDSPIFRCEKIYFRMEIRRWECLKVMSRPFV